MSEKEKKILDIFGALIPKMSDLDKERLLAFGEGMALMVARGNVAGPAPGTPPAKESA